MRLRAVALAAASLAAATPAAAAPRFDPPLHRDGRDAGAAFDLRRVAFGQRDLRMVLVLRTRRPWRTSALRGGRSPCLVLRGHGRLCLVAGDGPRPLVQMSPAHGEPRVIAAAVTRRDARSARAVFAAREAGLPKGPLRWAVEVAGEDRSPARGWHRALVELLAQPRCFGAAARDPLRACRNPALRRSVFPRPLDAFTQDNSPCRRLGDARRGPFAPCEFGITDGSHRGTFLLIGDSHAMHWRPALQVVAEARGWRGISVARPGCPFSARIPRSPALGPRRCARLHREAIGWLRSHPEVDRLFVSNWAPHGSTPIGGNAAYGGGAADYGAMLDRVPATVRRIHVLRDVPRTTVRTIDCVRARRRRGLALVRSCALPRSNVLVPDPGAASAAGRTRVQAIDLSHHFCGRARCFPVVGGAYVHKDLDHMNAVFSTSLGPFVLRALR